MDTDCGGKWLLAEEGKQRRGDAVVELKNERVKAASAREPG